MNKHDQKKAFINYDLNKRMLSFMIVILRVFSVKRVQVGVLHHHCSLHRPLALRHPEWLLSLQGKVHTQRSLLLESEKRLQLRWSLIEEELWPFPSCSYAGRQQQRCR